MAKYLDQNGLLYFWQQVKANHIDTKVDKVEGKGLSTNDFTTELLNKLNGISAGAQANVLEGVQVNGTDLTITGKKVNVVVPTKLSDLGAVTEADLDSALAEKVNAAAEGNHSHSNKTVLDGISSEKVTAWDGAAAKAHEHTNKSVLDGITSAKVSAWDAAEQNAKTYADGLADNYDAKGAAAAAETAAKTYADGLNTAMDTRVLAVEGKAHEHGNKTVIDGITAEKVAAWDAAEGNAKTYADGLNTAMDERVDALEAAMGEDGSVQDKIDASIAALDLANTYEAKGAAAAVQTALQAKIDEKAAASDVEALAGRVTTAEGKITTVEGKVANIEKDYLTSADKTELTNAIATAKTEAIEAVLDGVSEDYDTLKEIAAWIESDTTNSAQLVTRVSDAEKAIDAIEADYLKGADKTALQESIDAVSELVDTEGKTVSAYVEEAINAKVVVLTNSEIDAILAQ